MAYESDPVFQEPQCLIKTDGEGKLEVVEAVLKQISKISKPLNIVAIVGPSRSGKSYLLNRLAQTSKETVSNTSTAVATTLTPSTSSEVTTSTLASTSETSTTSVASASSTVTTSTSQTTSSSASTGFQLGSTTEAVTMGIWVWCRPHPIRKDEVLMLLDTEGIGDAKKSDRKHDNWIFFTATLLASTLVYNIKGVFNNDVLETLSLITEMSRYVMISESNNDDSNLALYMPNFIVSLRDTTLTPSKEGKTLTSHEYLEDILSCRPDKTESNEKYNSLRLCIRNYFRTRTCFRFGIPTKNWKDVNSLGELPADKLDEQYVLEENMFMNYVFSDCGPKLVITGEKVNGSMFATMTRDYVLATRNDNVLCIEVALSGMETTLNEKAVEACVRLYSDNMGKELQLPVSDDKILSDRHKSCTKDAIKQFLRMAVNDKKQNYQNMANEQMISEYERILERNKKESESRCQTILENLAKAMDQNIRENKYKEKGGYTQYQQDLSDIKREYKKQVDLGCMKESTLLMFMDSRLQEGQTIFNEEQDISELERKKELNAFNVKLEESIRTQKEMEQLVVDLKQQNEENKKQWEQRTEEKVKEVVQHHEKQYQAAVKEQERLLTEGFETKSKELKIKNDKLFTIINMFLNPKHKWFPTRFIGWCYRKLINVPKAPKEK